MADDNQAPPVSVEEVLAKRSKARSLRGKNEIWCPQYIERRFNSLLDLLSTMSEAFPNSSELDSFLNACKLNNREVEMIRNTYSFPDGIQVLMPELGDRTCNWHPERLCVYKDALGAGLRFPVHPFIIRLLAELQIHPCQLYPNSWRLLIIFILRCRDLKIPLSTTIFRSIFLVLNSSHTKKGWVRFQHRGNIPHMVNTKSFPDAHHFWPREFVVLYWEGGDWGEFFMKRFGSMEDSSHFIMELKSEELSYRDKLLEDNDRSHYRAFLTEKRLVEASLSFLPYEGNHFFS